MVSISLVPVITSLVILASFTYLIMVTERQSKARQTMQRSLEKLKKAYDELDEQARIIVKKDLELNKTQEELDKKLNSLYNLHKLSKAISSTFDAEKIFSQIDKSFITELGFDRGLIAFAAKEGKEFFFPVVVGFSEHQQIAIKQHLIQKDLLHKLPQPVLADGSISFDEEKKELSRILEMSSFCLVPLISQEAPLGLIIVGNDLPYAGVTEGDVEILSIFAGQIAGGIENVRLYEALWRSHQDLEKRVTERTRELALANEKLKKIDKLKSEFVSAVSHELRTPLTSIKGYAAILMAGKLGEVPEAVKERLDKINRHSDSLTQLVNDLLDISRIESGKVGMKLEQLKLKEIIDEVSDLVMPQVKERKIQLNTEVPAELSLCLADKVQLVRVFTNLLGNALKFTPEKGTIAIKVKEQKDAFLVDVSDTGIGIADENLENIFEEFYRVDNAINQNIKGTGLGLSLVRRIIQAHKGRIWVESTVGVGTTFSFTLPKA